MRDGRTDVLVVGAGPAGAVAAMLLARAGASVSLLHRTSGHRPAIGEVLPPPARPAFERLGLGLVFEDTAHLAAPGTLVAWGSDHPRATDALFHPYGPGLHLDRERFDLHLRTMATAAGARLVPASRAFDSDLVASPRPGSPPVIVDCSGRSAVVARAYGVHVGRYDALVAVVGVLDRGAGSADLDARTYVAATADGWWYSALLPDGRRSAAFLTDRDLLPAALRREPRTWHHQLLAVPVVGDLVRSSGAPPPAVLSVRAADSRRASSLGKATGGTQAWQAAGRPAVVLAGDAAMAFDPLSSMGILAAVESAAAAVPVVLAQLGGGAAAIQDAADLRLEADDRRWAAYRERLAEAYAEERRWAGSPFWARRQVRERWAGGER